MVNKEVGVVKTFDHTHTNIKDVVKSTHHYVLFIVSCGVCGQCPLYLGSDKLLC